MSWFHYILPLIIGIALASFGVLFATMTIKGLLAGERTNLRRFATVAICGFSFVFVAAGLCTIAAVITGPTPIEARRVSDAVFRVTPNEVAEIEIRPYPHEAYPQLVSETLVIRNAADIETICRAMSVAETYSPNHPDLVWSCFLVLSINGQKRVCEVQGTSNNGVLLEAVSDSDVYSWRTRYGTYQSNQLGSALKALAAK